MVAGQGVKGWWGRRSKKGKAGLIVLSLFLVIWFLSSLGSDQESEVTTTSVEVAEVAKPATTSLAPSAITSTTLAVTTTTAKTTTSVPPTATTAAPTKSAGALTMETLPAYLERVLPREAKGQVGVTEGWAVVMYTSEDNFDTFMKTAARQYARDFVFAAYATRLPLKGVQIVVSKPDGSLGLSVALGANVARSQPETTWTDDMIGPTIFIDWMKSVSSGELAEDENGAYIAGPWAE